VVVDVGAPVLAPAQEDEHEHPQRHERASACAALRVKPVVTLPAVATHALQPALDQLPQHIGDAQRLHGLIQRQLADMVARRRVAGGTGGGAPPVEHKTLNRAAILAAVGGWEAFVEDLATEALGALPASPELSRRHLARDTGSSPFPTARPVSGRQPSRATPTPARPRLQQLEDELYEINLALEADTKRAGKGVLSSEEFGVRRRQHVRDYEIRAAAIARLKADVAFMQQRVEDPVAAHDALLERFPALKKPMCISLPTTSRRPPRTPRGGRLSPQEDGAVTNEYATGWLGCAQ